METDSSNGAGSPLKGKRVFIVEDDDFLVRLLSEKISSHSLEVSAFRTGEDALKEISRNAPSIVVLDVMLPGIDGFEVLETLKKNPETKDIPVLIVSNAHKPESEQRAKSLGAGFMLKALTTPVEIAEQVEKTLSKSK